ncbi:SpoIID/LytB domain-containing protein [Scatolibacter rhodanostii]|uniref:SpoIID/LytB domain-containing protein n=1 Tax=Scatolibacter rhodanostii TaxID=2014781 RepID=UPI000C08C976|nr:SpoIID/LytB domain-containing protein [Scatolibacter rhodanostii]
METKQKKYSHKHLALYVLLLYLLFLFLPLGIFHLRGDSSKASVSPAAIDSTKSETNTKAAPSATPDPSSSVPGFLDGVTIFPQKGSTTAPTSAENDIFRIKDSATDTILTVAAKDFLPAAVACEMPLSAPDESLKAQAVAAYTYYSAQRNVNKENDYDLTCNSDAWLIYTTPEKMQERWGEQYDTYMEKANLIVNSVYGEMLTENNEPILASYFAISNGSTEASANVWGSERSYLTSVASPGDLLSDGYLSYNSFTADEIREKLQAAFPDLSFDFSTAESDWFTSQELSSAGYTNQINVCGITIEGTKLRTALALASTSFDVNFNGTNFAFTVRGHGHGVGMSQVGAIYMAEQGSNYQEILAHYYPGTTLTNITYTP